MSHGRKKDQQDASHNRPPPYPSCGSRLRHWLHPPQKVPKVQDGLLGLYLIPFPSTRKHKCRVGRVQPLHHPPIQVAPIHRSAWKGNSANFGFTAFCEVRYTLATPSYGKDSSFGRYAIPSLGSIMVAQNAPAKGEARERGLARCRCSWTTTGTSKGSPPMRSQTPTGRTRRSRASTGSSTSSTGSTKIRAKSSASQKPRTRRRPRPCTARRTD